MIFLVIFLLFFLFNIYSIDYYICLGSFIDSNNALELSINLNKIGIGTIHETVKINNKNFTRVLFNKKITNLKEAINEVEMLQNNEIIKKENILDLWIRPGKLINAKKIDEKILNSSIVEKEKTESKNFEVDKNNKEKIENEKVAVKEQEIKKTEIVKEEKKENVQQSIPIIKKESEEKKKDIAIESKYRIISIEGYANCIFANEPIEVGKEDNYQLKTIFNKPEKIYARCFLPDKIGEIKPEDFWHEIWIDDKFIRKTIFNYPPDPDWDQIQIWISEEDYSDIINSLEKGEYKITIWVLKNEIVKVKDTTELKTVNLSKGEFTYIVP